MILSILLLLLALLLLLLLLLLLKNTQKGNGTQVLEQPYATRIATALLLCDATAVKLLCMRRGTLRRERNSGDSPRYLYILFFLFLQGILKCSAFSQAASPSITVLKYEVHRQQAWWRSLLA
jgi:hypothetical protein